MLYSQIQFEEFLASQSKVTHTIHTTVGVGRGIIYADVILRDGSGLEWVADQIHTGIVLEILRGYEMVKDEPSFGSAFLYRQYAPKAAK